MTASPALRYAAAVAMAGLATLAALVAERWVTPGAATLVFVLPVAAAAAWFGLAPALAAAGCAVLAFNFFLTEPRYTLRIDDPANVWALGLLAAVALIVSAVAAQSRRRALGAIERARAADALQDLARSLVAARDRGAILAAAAGALGQAFKAPGAVLTDEGEGLAVAATTPETEVSEPDLDAARWAFASRLAVRAGAYPAEASAFDLWPVPIDRRPLAVVGVAGLTDGRPANADSLARAIGDYLAVALERDALAAREVKAQVAHAGERLKANLLAAVSHDLKTPLSTILFTLQSLQRFRHDAAASAELLALAEAETARLAGLVANLLDMSRIDADAVAVKLAPVAPADLAASALARAAPALAGHAVTNDVGAGAPALMADYALAETALANVLENAGKYSPPGAAIRVSALADGIEVADAGPGFAGPVAPLFEKFARGVEGDGRPPGTGLGLAIAKGFLEAQGGSIEAANRADGPGAVVRLRLRPA